MAEQRFADRLRFHRQVAGLTQEELAERAGLSVRGISDLERGVKKRPHPETVRLLATALDLSAADLDTFRRAANPNLTIAADQPLTVANLPVAMTPLVGREAELQALEALLDPQSDVRLVTLTGPGGVGKTRLAMQVAQNVRERFPDRAIFISLASLDAPDQVLPAIAQQLGGVQLADRSALDHVIRLLNTRSMLVVLDNFEHLLAASPDIATLLARCPGVVVLATSRSPLRLTGERQMPVESLAAPESVVDQTPDELLRWSAVQVFVRQAQNAAPGFELTSANVMPVATICSRLEGLPLSLELAAARLRTLSPAELAGMLSSRLDVLVGGERDRSFRHQSLRATIRWSYDLLSPPERTAFQFLAIFAGGATRQAATAVISGDNQLETLELLEGLLDQSLLHRRADSAGTSRYSMLETIRDYGLQRLVENGLDNTARAAHAGWFLWFAEEGEQALTGPDQAAWMRHLAADYDNLRVAIAWFVDQGDAESSQRMCSALWRFWAASGRLQEGHAWLERVLMLDVESATVARGNALLRAGHTAMELSRNALAQQHYEASRRVFAELGDEERAARALSGLGLVHRLQGRLTAARSAHELALSVWRDREWQPGVATELVNLGRCALDEQNYHSANHYFGESRAIRRMLGDDVGVAWTQHWEARAARLAGRPEDAVALLDASVASFRLAGEEVGTAATESEYAFLALDQGHYQEAINRHHSAIETRRRVGDVLGPVDGLEGIGRAEIALGHVERGVTLLAWAVTWRASHQDLLVPQHQLAVDQVLEMAGSLLDDEVFNAAWSAGAALTADEAIDVATSRPSPPRN